MEPSTDAQSSRKLSNKSMCVDLNCVRMIFFTLNENTTKSLNVCYICGGDLKSVARKRETCAYNSIVFAPLLKVKPII